MGIDIIKSARIFIQSIINRFNYSLLRTKLILLFFVVIAFSSGFITLFLFKATEDTILKQSEKSSAAYIYQISKRFELLMENIHKGTLGITFNRALIGNILNSNNYDYDYLDSITRSIEMMASFSNSNRYIYSMNIYDFKNNLLLTSKYKRTLIDKKSEDYGIIKRYFIDSKNTFSYKWVETREIYDYSVKRRVLSLIMPINNSPSNNMIGAIVTYVKEDEISGIFAETDAAENGTVYLVDNNSVIISAVDKDIIGKKLNGTLINSNVNNTYSFIKQLNGEKNLVIFRKLQNIDWSFVCIIPVKNLMVKNVYALQKTFILFFVIVVLVSFIISSLLNIHIYRPVGILVRKLRESNKNTLLKDFHLDRKDEIGFIFNSFNDIFKENKILMKDNYEQKLLLKDAEIRLLHSQINSHFLYNSLDSVIWMAKAKNYKKIIFLINALVVFFRISLDRGNEFIKVEKVKEQLECYFAIQKIRYSDRLDVEIDIEPSIYEYAMLKLLLQPVVENSVLHGIEKKRGAGFIKVRGRKDGDILIFTVEDNGVGIPEDKLQQINRVINEDEPNANDFYALHNINKRIKLFYGAEYGLKLESNEGQGTTVNIRFPPV